MKKQSPEEKVNSTAKYAYYSLINAGWDKRETIANANSKNLYHISDKQMIKVELKLMKNIKTI